MPSKQAGLMSKNTLQLAIVVLVGVAVTVSIFLYFGVVSIGANSAKITPELAQTHMKRRMFSPSGATSATYRSATAGRP